MINEDLESKYESLEEDYAFLEKEYFDLKNENDNLKDTISLFISYTDSMILSLRSDILELESSNSTRFNLSNEESARKEAIRILHNVIEDLEIYSKDFKFEEFD